MQALFVALQQISANFLIRAGRGDFSRARHEMLECIFWIYPSRPPQYQGLRLTVPVSLAKWFTCS
jgi:hypothetical protein